MGAILAVLSSGAGPDALAGARAAFARGVARSPHRGAPASLALPQGILGIQAHGDEAGLGADGPWRVAFHGWIGNWEDLARSFGVPFPPEWNGAQRFARFYSRHGESFLRAARGEFAAVAADTSECSLHAVRGHLGTRPLYVHPTGPLLILATEIRQALAAAGTGGRLHLPVLVELVGRVPLVHEETVWEGVNRVPPAHCLRWGPTGRQSLTRFWLPREPQGSPERSLDELAEELRALLERAVARALPQGPYGVAMSGGLDSTTVWTLARNLEGVDPGGAGRGVPLSLVFPADPSCDESPFIEAVAAHTGIAGERIAARGTDPLTFLPRQLEAGDWPPAGTLYHLDLLGARAHDLGIPVLLVGLGGDEWFQGSVHAVLDHLLAGHPLEALRDFLTLPLPEGCTRAGALWGRVLRPRLALRRRLGLSQGRPWLSQGASDLLAVRTRSFRSDEVPSCPWSVRELFENFLTLCGGETYEALEQHGAALGLELRHPLLDVDLAEFAFSVPPRFHLAEGQTKHLLRRAARGLLPEAVRLRPDKTAFDSSFKEPCREILARGWDLSRGVLARAGFLDPTWVQDFPKKYWGPVSGFSLGWDLYCMDSFADKAFGTPGVAMYEARPNPTLPGNPDIIRDGLLPYEKPRLEASPLEQVVAGGSPTGVRDGLRTLRKG
ncbi:MAG: hypothetical protein HY823_14485 [Acidobacteria bacterium]|nr:hypothetical protein [Acidobacteriota bacterium]